MATPVRLRTAKGDIDIEVFDDAAPASAAYFLTQVRCARFDGTDFFRLVRPEDEAQNPRRAISVIQGGIAPPADGVLEAIAHEPTGETGLRHRRGTVSLARFSPGAVYGSFFVCFRDEPALDECGARHEDGAGFAAFGRVTSGLDIVEFAAGQLRAARPPLVIERAAVRG